MKMGDPAVHGLEAGAARLLASRLPLTIRDGCPMHDQGVDPERRSRIRRDLLGGAMPLQRRVGDSPVGQHVEPRAIQLQHASADVAGGEKCAVCHAPAYYAVRLEPQPVAPHPDPPHPSPSTGARWPRGGKRARYPPPRLFLLPPPTRRRPPRPRTRRTHSSSGISGSCRTRVKRRVESGNSAAIFATVILALESGRSTRPSAVSPARPAVSRFSLSPLAAGSKIRSVASNRARSISTELPPFGPGRRTAKRSAGSDTRAIRTERRPKE